MKTQRFYNKDVMVWEITCPCGFTLRADRECGVKIFNGKKEIIIYTCKKCGQEFEGNIKKIIKLN